MYSEHDTIDTTPSMNSILLMFVKPRVPNPFKSNSETGLVSSPFDRKIPPGLNLKTVLQFSIYGDTDCLGNEIPEKHSFEDLDHSITELDFL